MTHQAQCSLPYFSALPSDVITNVLHFDFTGVGAPSGSDLDNMITFLAGFYESIFPGGSQNVVAPWVRPDLFRIKIYDLDMPIPRPPLRDEIVPLTVAQATVSKVPLEAAVCISQKAAPVPGISLGSTRGRLYVGGLGDGCLANGTASAFPTPSADFIAGCITAASNMLTGPPIVDWQWVIYSPTLSTSFPVLNGFVDNAIDTQRRRGNGPSARVLW